jgi:hypothetical protein
MEIDLTQEVRQHASHCFLITDGPVHVVAMVHNQLVGDSALEAELVGARARHVIAPRALLNGRLATALHNVHDQILILQVLGHFIWHMRSIRGGKAVHDLKTHSSNTVHECQSICMSVHTSCCTCTKLADAISRKFLRKPNFYQQSDLYITRACEPESLEGNGKLTSRISLYF